MFGCLGVLGVVFGCSSVLGVHVFSVFLCVGVFVFSCSGRCSSVKGSGLMTFWKVTRVTREGAQKWPWGKTGHL